MRKKQRRQRGPCKECGRDCSLQPRGLCWKHYWDKAVRAKHESKNPACMSAMDEDITMEALEAIIAERMENLPAWWHEDVRKQDHVEFGYLKERRPKVMKDPKKGRQLTAGYGFLA